MILSKSFEVSFCTAYKRKIEIAMCSLVIVTKDLVIFSKDTDNAEIPVWSALPCVGVYNILGSELLALPYITLLVGS